MTESGARVVWLVRIAGDGDAARTLFREMDGPLWSRSTPEVVIDGNGFPSAVQGVWTSLSVWSREDAPTADRWIELLLGSFPTAFVARMAVLSTRGQGLWGADDWTPPWGEAAGGSYGGAVVAVTSVGGDFGGMDAAMRFAAAVDETRRSAAHAPGNLGAGILFDLTLPGDGLTVTVWDSKRALTDWAYRGEVHPASMARTGTDWDLERTSFSRFAVEQLSGRWEATTLTA